MFDSACAPDSRMTPGAFFASGLALQETVSYRCNTEDLGIADLSPLTTPECTLSPSMGTTASKVAESDPPVLFLAPPLLSSETTTGGGRTLWILALQTTVASEPQRT